MEITSINKSYTSSFSARNQNIRKADKIMRETKQAFPSISPLYAREFYSIFTKENPDKRAVKIRKKIDKNITQIRSCAEEYTYGKEKLSSNYHVNKCLAILFGLSKLKTGNCNELCIATLGALAANGYYNSYMNNLNLNIEITNNKTGATEYQATLPIDHVLIKSTMDNVYNNESNNKSKRTNIIIDPWLGFVDSKSGAIEKYKKAFDKQISSLIDSATFELEIDKKIMGKENINWDDYDIKANFEFEPDYNLSANGIKEFGLYTSMMLDEKK